MKGVSDSKNALLTNPSSIAQAQQYCCQFCCQFWLIDWLLDCLVIYFTPTHQHTNKQTHTLSCKHNRPVRRSFSIYISSLPSAVFTSFRGWKCWFDVERWRKKKDERIMNSETKEIARWIFFIINTVYTDINLIHSHIRIIKRGRRYHHFPLRLCQQLLQA